MKLKQTARECGYVLETIELDGWRLGRTKVFLKYYHTERLSDFLDKEMRRVVIVQKSELGAIVDGKIDSFFFCYLVVRGWLARRELSKLQREFRRYSHTAEAFLHAVNFKIGSQFFN